MYNFAGTGITNSAANAQISNNRIIGNGNQPAILNGANYVQIKGNYVTGSYWPTLYQTGSYGMIQNNYVASSGNEAIGADGSYNTIQNNQLYLTGGAAGLGGNGTSNSFISNQGYNPVGHIADPFSANYILDSGGSATPTNKTVMTNWESPKTVNIQIGSSWTSAHTFVVQIDGVTWDSTTTPTAVMSYKYHLNPGQTFYCQYQSGQATFTVSGE
jgi:hypothetical protein